MMAKFRPPQQILDLFWTLSDGDDEQRSAGAVKLARLIKTSEESDKKEIIQYCQERLVRGLSSGRKFARVGFSVALVQLLREIEEIGSNSILSTMKTKLKAVGYERKSQSEIGGIFLGQAFAVSALIQAGRIDQLSGDVLQSLVHQLMNIGDKKSYLKAICDTVLRDLVLQVSPENFGNHVWPKLKERMKQGWASCTLETLALLLACRTKFPEVVKKKYLRKYWGFPILCEDNDKNLLLAILASTQRSDILLDQILPHMLQMGRDIVSLWTAIGEKLMQPLMDVKWKVRTQRKVLGLKIASYLLSSSAHNQQILDVVLSPGLATCVFHPVSRKDNVVATAADSLCQQVCSRLAGEQTLVLQLLEKLWKLEASLSEQEPDQSARIDLVKSNNFLQLADLMSKADAESYSHSLIAMVMGNDKWEVTSSDPVRKLKQTECCLRQLQHMCTTQLDSMIETQRSVLALFLRLAFFQVTKKTKRIEHCQSCINLVEESTERKLTQVLFYKILDSLFTPLTGQQKKWNQLSSYLELLYGLAHYVQDLLKAETILSVGSLHPQITTEWPQLLEFCQKIRETSESQNQGKQTAFLLCALFLGFYMLIDFKVAMELLQDVYVCYEKAEEKEDTDMSQDEHEPQWIEVMMDVLLKVMSLQSHLGRVIAGSVFRLLSKQVTPAVVSLITEVVSPVKSATGGAGDFMVETDDIDEDEETSDLNDDHEKDESESDDEEISSNHNSETENGHLEETESLPDLSDSEMFKMDDMLAAVFKLRRKSVGKKAKEEKQQELINFQVRVLDFVEILIKGERCGDFVLNLLKPLVSLMLKSGNTGSQVLADRAKTLFTTIKSKAQALKDCLHSPEDQTHLFHELLDLAKKATEKRHLQQISAACCVLTNLDVEQSRTQDQSRSYIQLLMASLERVICKKSSKPHVTFYTLLIEQNPSQFQELGPHLVHKLKEESVKPHGRMICCLVLSSLCKKPDTVKEVDVLAMKQWMREAAQVVTQLIVSLDKVMFYKEVLMLTVALQARHDLFMSEVLFGADIKEHLMKIKSKFNTDIRRLANRIISAINKNNCQPVSTKKRKASDSDLKSPSNKKMSLAA